MIKKITIYHTIATDSMGDWGTTDQSTVANAFAQFLAAKWADDVEKIEELDGFQVEISIDTGLSMSSTASVYVETGDSDEEFQLMNMLENEFDSNRYWEKFCCDSEFARSLNEDRS